MSDRYKRVAEREIERQKDGKGRVGFKPVIYGEEPRCKTCWTRLSEFITEDDKIVPYCPNCAAAIR